MKIAIISNGMISCYQRIKEKIENYDYIICADGGAQHAYNMKMNPNLIVGDFDSTPANIMTYFKNLDVEVRDFPPEKDLTDTHLAIEVALLKKPNLIGLFGATGTRMDHTLSNIQHLLYIKEQKSKGIVIDDYNEIFLAEEGQTVLNGHKGDIVSLISLSEKTKGITLKGFKYPLNNKTLLQGDSLCISNEMKEKKAIIYKKEGSLLIIKSRD